MVNAVTFRSDFFTLHWPIEALLTESDADGSYRISAGIN
jgi:hypothetical protein|tara:strand:- start:324 stop:440 length:117 start_codon:yes stop_codon:yes gene_type:complete